MTDKKTCFVVQGFGIKPDYATGRKLNLDESYEMIKEAVTDAGLECVRADEIMHSGSIDVEMWEAILNADLVVADVSTSNWNAAYELGVRHALRPRTTIVIAEKQFEFAFDINHIAVHTYTHLGEEIGSKEKPRFTKHLQSLIEKVLADTEEGAKRSDSPVYLSISGLEEPGTDQVAKTEPAATAAGGDPNDEPTTWKAYLDKGLAAKKEGNWIKAAVYLEDAHNAVPRDEFVTQQLALATYKSEEPDEEKALLKAKSVLATIRPPPETSNNTETLGIWGAIHKRLWKITAERPHLDDAIRSYGRGFWLANDYYNGINFAFLLNARAAASEPAQAIADYVQAREIRREVIGYATEAKDTVEKEDDEYWITATLWEAYVGLDDDEEAARWEDAARKVSTADWMIEGTAAQIAELRAMLEDPPTRWIRAGEMDQAADADPEQATEAPPANKAKKKTKEKGEARTKDAKASKAADQKKKAKKKKKKK